jgi:hypothetical protein
MVMVLLKLYERMPPKENACKARDLRSLKSKTPLPKSGSRVMLDDESDSKGDFIFSLALKLDSLTDCDFSLKDMLLLAFWA